MNDSMYLRLPDEDDEPEALDVDPPDEVCRDDAVQCPGRPLGMPRRRSTCQQREVARTPVAPRSPGAVARHPLAGELAKPGRTSSKIRVDTRP